MRDDADATGLIWPAAGSAPAPGCEDGNVFAYDDGTMQSR